MAHIGGIHFEFEELLYIVYDADKLNITIFVSHIIKSMA